MLKDVPEWHILFSQKSTGMIHTDKHYHIHPAYTLIPDKHCAFIANSREWGMFEPHPDIDDNFSQLISPLFASIFAYWNGKKTYAETLKAICADLQLQAKPLEDMLKPCFENPERIQLRYPETDGQAATLKHWIPRHFIVESQQKSERNDLRPPKDFILPARQWDFSKMRTQFPHSLSFMLTNHCVTDCIYCYADKRPRDIKSLPTARWIELVREADAMGCLNVDLAGGEVFLHPDIEQILQALHQRSFHPYLSTKIPLSEEKIRRLSDAGMRELQLSIDSWDNALMEKMLRVPPSYFPKLQQSLEALEKHGIKVKVKSVITCHNDATETIEKLLTRLTAFHNIQSVSIAPAEYSLYKGYDQFQAYRTNRKQWEKVKACVSAFAESCKSPCIIDCQEISDSRKYFASVDEKCASFPQRARCTGNISSLFILPDGKAGICEELYWHPKFIVGDVTTQSIRHVWESEKALSLYMLSQEKFRRKSVCSICPDFDPCHQRNGVCWKEIIEAYGEENHDFPDPRCPYAPPVTHKFYIS
ncbi:MAG: radical SAM protein [Bacteroidales bacterium]|nr:radical SAM protein [Bacteroidales bacterium]